MLMHKERVQMFGIEKTTLLEKIENLEASIEARNIVNFRQLETADLSKNPVNGGITGTSGFYGALMMNADEGGIKRSKAAKLWGRG